MEGERKKAEGEAKKRMEEERRAFAEARKSMVTTAAHHVKDWRRKHSRSAHLLKQKNKSISSAGLRKSPALRKITFINHKQKIKLIQS